MIRAGQRTLEDLAGALILSLLAVTVAAAQPAPSIDTSGWKTYRSDAMGFEVRHPPTWRVTPAKGTGPEMVILGEPSQGERRQVPVQFWVQRDINPTGLSIDDWYADQLKRFKATGPPAASTDLAGRRALRREIMGSLGRHYDFFTTLNKSDIFQATITQPSDRLQLDPTIRAILSTIKFID